MYDYETDPNIKLAELSELGDHSASEFGKCSSLNRKLLAGVICFTTLSLSDEAFDTLTELGDNINAGVGICLVIGYLVTNYNKVSYRRQWLHTAAETIRIARQNSIEVPEWSLEGLPKDYKERALAH